MYGNPPFLSVSTSMEHSGGTPMYFLLTPATIPLSGTLANGFLETSHLDQCLSDMGRHTGGMCPPMIDR